jgi:hypothetical protein
MKWYGYILKMNEERMSGKVLNVKVKGKGTLEEEEEELGLTQGRISMLIIIGREGDKAV